MILSPNLFKAEIMKLFEIELSLVKLLGNIQTSTTDE